MENISEILLQLVQELNTKIFSSDEEKKIFIENYFREKGIGTIDENEKQKLLSQMPSDLRLLISKSYNKPQEEKTKTTESFSKDIFPEQSEQIKKAGQEVVEHIINKIERKEEVKKETKLDISVLFEGDEDIFFNISNIPSNFLLFNEKRDVKVLGSLRGKDQEKYLSFLNSANKNVYELDNQKLISSSKLPFSNISDINIVYHNIKKFLLKEFTSLNEEDFSNITIQDSLFLTTFIASGLLGNPVSIFAICNIDNSNVRVNIDLNSLINEFVIVDKEKFENHLKNYNMNFLEDEKKILYEDDFCIMKFDFPSFIYEPIIFESNPLLLLSALLIEFTNKKLNKTKTFTKTTPIRQSFQIIEYLKTSTINRIFECLMTIALGFREETLYGINLTETRNFVCPKHNNKLEVINFHIFLQFFPF